MIIDTREKHLLDVITQKCDYEVKQLDLGDIIFTKDDETVMVIERKTISDLKRYL